MANAPPPPYSEVPANKDGPYPPAQAGYPPATAYPPAAGYGMGQPGAYPPPPPSYQGGAPPASSTQSTVIVSQPPMTVIQRFHEVPVRTTCPFCRADIVTATTYEAGTFSWLVCVILCLFGCNLGCCLIPFCMDGCQDVIHSCPNCRQQISRWGRM